MNSRFNSRFEEYVFWAASILLAVNAWIALGLSYPSLARLGPHFLTPYFFYISVFLDPVMALLILVYGPWTVFLQRRRGIPLTGFAIMKICVYLATFLLPFAWYGASTGL